MYAVDKDGDAPGQLVRQSRVALGGLRVNRHAGDGARVYAVNDHQR
jgi:hypothetical protein